MSFFNELKRRNVFRVAIAYLAAAWLLTEVASTLFPLFGVPDWGTRFVVIVFALGFIPSLVFSWIYELTPEGLKREREVVRDESITQLTAKRLDFFTIGMIVVALGFILSDRLWLTPRLEKRATTFAEIRTDDQNAETRAGDFQYPQNSIAVLPFINMSADADNEYFSDGISEELLNLLATVPELRVTARTSSFSFKGKDVKIADIARELKVAHVLEGSVRKAGNRVRVTAQLIETGSDTHIWSATFDRNLDDIFGIQDEIAGEVVKSMEVLLLGDAPPKARETDPEAYALYLQCRHFGAGGLEELRRGEQYCWQSLEIDPNYAPAWAVLGTIYTNLATSGYVSFKDGYAKGMEKGDFDAGQLREIAAAESASVEDWRKVDLGEFRGFTGSFIEENVAIREWYVSHGPLLLFITYSCDEENRGMDDAAVDELLDTLLVQQANGSP